MQRLQIPDSSTRASPTDFFSGNDAQLAYACRALRHHLPAKLRQRKTSIKALTSRQNRTLSCFSFSFFSLSFGISMAPSRRLSNGRSPLVNQQRQITSFFSRGKSTISPPPSISLEDSPSSGPSANPSPPSQTKPKKPPLVVGPPPARRSPNATPSPESGKKPYSAEVVGKRIKVYWPLDKCWYDGCVKSFDEKTRKHVVQYDDAEEEALDLGEEKIEWVEEAARSLRRLRRISDCVKAMAVEKEAADGGNGGDKESSDGGGGDDSMDEDWEKIGEKDLEGGDEDDKDLEVELDEDDEEVERPRVVPVGKSGSRKRKNVEEDKLSSGKKCRVGGNVEKNVLKVLMDSSGSKAGQLADSAESA